MKKKKQVIIGIFVITLLISLLALPIQKTISGNAVYSSQLISIKVSDNYILENSGFNFGGDAEMNIGKTSGGKEFRSIIKFDLSPISSKEIINNAKLQIHVSTSSTIQNRTINLYKLTSNWNETASNWTSKTELNLWENSGGDYEIIPETSIEISNKSETDYNLTITSLVQNWIEQESENYGLILIGQGFVDGEIIEIVSSDSSIEIHHPKILLDSSSESLNKEDSESNEKLTNLKEKIRNIKFPEIDSKDIVRIAIVIIIILFLGILIYVIYLLRKNISLASFIKNIRINSKTPTENAARKMSVIERLNRIKRNLGTSQEINKENKKGLDKDNL